MERIGVETSLHAKAGRLLQMVIRYKKLEELLNVRKQMNDMKISCAPTNSGHESWDNINWNRCNAMIRKLQARIVKAQKEGRYGKVKALQWTLTHSFSAKAMAVKRVTTNKGNKTSGIDKIIWSTSDAKFNQ